MAKIDKIFLYSSEKSSKRHVLQDFWAFLLRGDFANCNKASTPFITKKASISCVN
jgi:hypothetical protein